MNFLIALYLASPCSAQDLSNLCFTFDSTRNSLMKQSLDLVCEVGSGTRFSSLEMQPSQNHFFSKFKSTFLGRAANFQLSYFEGKFLMFYHLIRLFQ